MELANTVPSKEPVKCYQPTADSNPPLGKIGKLHRHRPSLYKLKRRREEMVCHFRKFTPWQRAAGPWCGGEDREMLGRARGNWLPERSGALAFPIEPQGWLMPVPNA